MGVQRG